MKMEGFFLTVLLFASFVAIGRAMPSLSPKSLESYASRFPNDLTLWVYRQAVRCNHPAVAQAALYNEAHLLCEAIDLGLAKSAVDYLEKFGDDYTLIWLDKLEDRSDSAARPALFKGARDAIAKRLERAPSKPEQILEARLFRAAVANVTSNRLELSLPKFIKEWTAVHSSSAPFVAELERIGNRESPDGRATFVSRVQRLVIGKARGISTYR